MAKLEKHKVKHIITFIGDFNPKIFHPNWFVAEGILGKEEGSEAELKIIHNDLASFAIDWMFFEVTVNRCVIWTEKEPYFEALRDVAIGTFSILSHSPIKALGLNWEFTYKSEKEEDLHLIGNMLAPKEIWDGVIENPGLRKMTMRSPKEGVFKGEINVNIQPDVNTKYGVVFNLNDHYDLEEGENTLLGSSQAIEVIQKDWQTSKERCKQIPTKLLENIYASLS